MVSLFETLSGAFATRGIFFRLLFSVLGRYALLLLVGAVAARMDASLLGNIATLTPVDFMLAVSNSPGLAQRSSNITPSPSSSMCGVKKASRSSMLDRLSWSCCTQTRTHFFANFTLGHTHVI